MNDDFADSEEPITSVPVRILTYNIHGGVGMDEAIDLERLAAVIRQANPDLVAIQELDRFTDRSGLIDQPEVLAELLGMNYVFAKALDLDNGEYGVGVFSPLPLLDTATHELPAGPDTEVRAAAEVIVKVGAPPVKIRFVATHIDHESEAERIKQVEFLNGLYSEDTETPMILAGDMNAIPGSRPIEILGEHWSNSTTATNHPTFPAPTPTMKIDYVFYKPADRFVTVETEVIEETVASDHRPLLVMLELLS